MHLNTRVRQGLVKLFSSGEHQKATDVMVDHIMFSNPGANQHRMLRHRRFGEDGRLEHWDLSFCKIGKLPELFNTLVCGSLDLSSNNLQSLPESFGNITLGDDLNLCDNRQLKGVPNSFPNVKGEVLYINV